MGKVYLRWQTYTRIENQKFLRADYQIDRNDICYLFKCDKALNLVFVFSILMFIVEFIAIYPWSIIKWQRQNLSKGKMEKRNLPKVRIKKNWKRMICTCTFCTNLDIPFTIISVFFLMKCINSGLSAVF